LSKVKWLGEANWPRERGVSVGRSDNNLVNITAWPPLTASVRPPSRLKCHVSLPVSASVWFNPAPGRALTAFHAPAALQREQGVSNVFARRDRASRHQANKNQKQSSSVESLCLSLCLCRWFSFCRL